MAGQVDFLEAEADKYFDRDELILARSKYRQVLNFRPSAKVYNRLGLISFHRGHLKSAIKSFMKAVHEEPEDVYFWVNLGMAYSQFEDYNQAQKCYDEALTLDEYCWEALNASGSLYAERGYWQLAEGMLNRASLIEPFNPDLLNNMGNIYKFQGAFPEAKENYRKALELDPNNANLFYNLGCLAHSTGKTAEAIEYFEQCVQIDDENDSARHLLASLKGETTAVAPESYITELFDAYASSFEISLQEDLEYDIPKCLHRLLGSSEVVFDHLLDLGCGTGLVGREFKERAKVLTGVDLSSAMLKVAEGSQAYTHLQQAEIYKFLIADDKQYDLFIASDVLIYTGDLQKIFKALTQRATPEATFLFSVEIVDCEDYQLQPTGRYAHSRIYIEQLAVETGWNVEAVEMVNIRKDKSVWIEGATFLFKRA